MATHTAHPSTHEYGLADGCPRCEEHATTLIYLDRANLLAIKMRIEEGLSPRSVAEGRAMGNLERVLSLARKVASCWICGGKALPEYTFCSDACATYHTPRGATG